MSKFGSGEWAVKTSTGILIERLSESSAWDQLLHAYIDPAVELLHKDKVLAKRHQKWKQNV